MRLPDERALALAASAALILGGVATPAQARHKAPALPPAATALAAANGPNADFPVTIGDPYAVGDTQFTPADAFNVDAVGYATVAPDARGGVWAMHHTLPVPSYIEVTSLESGRTILVRVDTRGPMDGTELVTLSHGAAQQLGLSSDKSPVRVRRVNPPENERSVLRAGGTAPERMATPKALLAVLTRKLDSNGTVSLGRSGPPPANSGAPEMAAATSGTPLAAMAARGTPAPRVAKASEPKPRTVAGQAITDAGLSHGSPRAKLLASGTPLPRAGMVASAPVAAPADSSAEYSGFVAPPSPSELAAAPAKPKAKLAAKAPPRAKAAPVAAPAPILAEAPAAQTADAVRANLLVVQAGAFAVKANAQSVATRIGAKVHANGNVFRVQMGPFASRDAAEAALAKARSAGYSTARIQRAE